MRNVAKHTPHGVEIADFAVGKEQATRYRVLLIKPFEQSLDLPGVLAFTVVKQHVTTEVRVAAEHFV